MEFAGCCPTCDEFACGVGELRCGFCGFRLQFGGSRRRAGFSRHVSIPAPRPPVLMVGNPRARGNVNDIVQDLLTAMADLTDQVYVVLLAVRESARDRDTRAVASVEVEDTWDEDSDSDFEDVFEEIPEAPEPPPRPETCDICCDRPQDSLLSPCGHPICAVCGWAENDRSGTCPWCKGNIEDVKQLRHGESPSQGLFDQSATSAPCIFRHVDSTQLEKKHTLPVQVSCASSVLSWTGAATARNVKHCGEHCPKDLNTELHRIHTFYGWPESTPVRPEHLAKLGFFYLGVRDKVECAFCGGVLHQWEEGDDPKREHERHYPHCPFIRNCATSNVPLDSPDGDSSDGQSERRGHTESEPPPPPGGTDCPKHPELSSEEDRLSTFFRWPLYSPISPRKLAQAGFYYTYIDDQVKCYWCEGGLKDWQAGDDPWTEHARWYGEECGFVLRERGIGYVRQIKNTFPSLVQVAHHHSQQDFVQDFIVGSANVTVQVGNLDPEDEFEERVLDAMDSRVVRNVVEMGFGQQNVETVVRRRLRARRGPFTTMTDLVESLLAMDEHPDGQGQDPDAEDEEDRNVEGPTPTGNQEPEEAAAEQMEEEPEEETPASMEELQQRLRRMKEERMCKICMSNDATMVFIPCGHLCCCEGCAHSMRSRGRKCPICRARILKVQRAFLA
ncbi:hypothetical protein Bbelb_008790 [Branchiostoma belcheri]|nr:hypothetical protein Bbelb_008790 [Branchiostoma belcheri]